MFDFWYINQQQQSTVKQFMGHWNCCSYIKERPTKAKKCRTVDAFFVNCKCGNITQEWCWYLSVDGWMTTDRALGVSLSLVLRRLGNAVRFGSFLLIALVMALILYVSYLLHTK